jgi:hypothetical protein
MLAEGDAGYLKPFPIPSGCACKAWASTPARDQILTRKSGCAASKSSGSVLEEFSVVRTQIRRYAVFSDRGLLQVRRVRVAEIGDVDNLAAFQKKDAVTVPVVLHRPRLASASNRKHQHGGELMPRWLAPETIEKSHQAHPKGIVRP